MVSVQRKKRPRVTTTCIRASCKLQKTPTRFVTNCIAILVYSVRSACTLFDARGMWRLQLEVVSFLSRVAGWSDDGVNISPELLDAIMTEAARKKRTARTIANVLNSAGNVLKSVKR